MILRCVGEPVRGLNFPFWQRAGIPYKDKRFTCKQATSKSTPRRRHSSDGWRGKGHSWFRDRANLTGYASQCTTYHTLVHIYFGTTTCAARSVSSRAIVYNRRFSNCALNRAKKKKKVSHILRHIKRLRRWSCYIEKFNCKGNYGRYDEFDIIGQWNFPGIKFA